MWSSGYCKVLMQRFCLSDSGVFAVCGFGLMQVLLYMVSVCHKVIVVNGLGLLQSFPLCMGLGLQQFFPLCGDRNILLLWADTKSARWLLTPTPILDLMFDLTYFLFLLIEPNFLNDALHSPSHLL